MTSNYRPYHELFFSPNLKLGKYSYRPEFLHSHHMRGISFMYVKIEFRGQ